MRRKRIPHGKATVSDHPPSSTIRSFRALVFTWVSQVVLLIQKHISTMKENMHVTEKNKLRVVMHPSDQPACSSNRRTSAHTTMQAIQSTLQEYQYTTRKYNAFRIYRAQAWVYYKSMKTCIILPVLPIVYITAMLAIPVGEPTMKLYEENWGLLLQLGGMCMAIGGMFTHIHYLILQQDFHFGYKEWLIIPISFPILFVATHLFETEVFFQGRGPVPFTHLLVGGPANLLALCMLFAILRPFNAQLWQKFKVCFGVTAWILSVYAIYQAIGVGYKYCREMNYEEWKYALILCLHATRIGSEVIVLRLTRFVSPELSSLLILLVNKYFTFLYVAVLIQENRGSVLGFLLLTALDWIENLILFASIIYYENRSQVEFVDTVAAAGLASEALTMKQNQIMPMKEEKIELRTSTFQSTPVDSVLLAKRAHACRILYMVEILLLTEYFEVVVPIMYNVYIVLVRQLPNRVYIYGGTDKDISDYDLQVMTKSIAVYSFIELISLFALMMVLERRFQYAMFPQLGFALAYNQRAILFMSTAYLIVVIVARYDHFGMDYSFQFDWLT